MLATVYSGAIFGVESLAVAVEVNTGERGELRLVLVGLPDAAVKESLDRVCSALQNSKFKLPHTRTTINLSPGHIRKEGPMYDLPIAIGVLLSSCQLNGSVSDLLIAGELSLSGKILPIRGAVALAIQAKRQRLRGIILPKASAKDAVLIDGIDVYGMESLDEVVRFINDRNSIMPIPHEEIVETHDVGLDFSDIKGQERAKRAAEIAVAGGHNLLMVGCPGVGKSMIAKRLQTIMPPPTLDELIEIRAVYSAAGSSLAGGDLCVGRPFRSPHHSISRVGLVGGGSNPRPGEISLAHNGVLFLDELAEFSRTTLESLRQPLDDGVISISRSIGKVQFPSNFSLIAAMNPCPCGYLGSKKRRCTCSHKQISDYRSRISGPLLDRIDLHIDVPAIQSEIFAMQSVGETSVSIRGRVAAARELQRKRSDGKVYCNARIPDGRLRQLCALGDGELHLMQLAIEQGALSARASGRVLRVARTIADLDGSERVASQHLMEAFQYRTLDIL
jgi:magnesium chelatase family protein